jgi:wobble nucleotide-excising tRNase
MNKKEKHILNINFMYEYYEDDITERYMKNLSTNVILDNDCFDIEPLEEIYVTPFKKYHQLEKENKELQEKIKKYEDPEDLTLMFMYCDEKAKDNIKELQERINKAIEYMRSEYTITDDDVYLTLYSSNGTLDKLEEILRGE